MHVIECLSKQTGLLLYHVAVTSKWPHFAMIKYGGFVSAASPFFLAMSTSTWAAVMFVVTLSFGEAIWSPRLYDYTMSIAPEVPPDDTLLNLFHNCDELNHELNRRGKKLPSLPWLLLPCSPPRFRWVFLAAICFQCTCRTGPRMARAVITMRAAEQCGLSLDC